MKTPLFYYLILIFTAANLSLYGINNNHEIIGDTSGDSIAVQQKNGAIILYENNSINITGKKADFIYFSITKKMKFKVYNSEGIDKFSEFTLPELFDPISISHFPKDKNYTYVFSDMKCNYFKGSILTKEGEKKDLKIKETIENVKMVMFEEDRYGNYKKFHYQIENLNEGDEVIIEYNYDVKYQGNFAELSSFRIFFNNELFKKNYQLKISHHIKLNFNIDYKNEAIPDSIAELDNRRTYYWNKSELYGCTNEQGARPHLSLPYLVFSIKPYELLYTLPYSFEEKFIPFYALYSHERERNHISLYKSISQGVKTRQMLQIYKFVKQETEDIKNDSTGYLKLRKLKNLIADEFTYENDIDYFKRIDTRDPRIGDYLSKRAIRDISRYDVYVALILKLDLNFFTAYLSDKRTGLIDNDYFSPMHRSDYIFAVLLNNNTFQYLYPKKSQFGYYLNEIPFYFENTTARLVHINDYRNYKKPIEEEKRLMTIPLGEISDNIRRTNAFVKIDLEKQSVSFDARANLSGQYSTLTRGLYQRNHKHETVNELYNKKIWELNKQVEVIKEECKVISKESPFTSNVNAKYQANNLLETNNDTLSLSLENWFNHIIYKDLDSDNRQLDFYPDFCGQDSYMYFLEFSKDIKLINTFEPINIKNEFGELTISVEQVKPNAIKISSFALTLKTHVTKDRINFVKAIYDEIQKMNNSSLSIKVDTD